MTKAVPPLKIVMSIAVPPESICQYRTLVAEMLPDVSPDDTALMVTGIG
jgi:hypothetical protein